MSKENKFKLNFIEREDKAFDCHLTIKKDAYTMPSKFFATTVFYPATKVDTQTYYTQIQADMYFGKEKIGTLRKSDEFDTAKEAKKWINEEFDEFLKIVL